MDLAEKKERSLSHENDFLSHFFEVVQALISEHPSLNHSKNPEEIGLSISKLEPVAREKGYGSLFYNVRELRKELLRSSHYLRHDSIYSPVQRRSIRIGSFKNVSL